MIDTVRLNLVDCEIKRSCPLHVQPAIIDYSTGTSFEESDLFRDNTGRIIRGVKAYLNDDKFNLTINPSFEFIQNDDNHNKIKPKRFHRTSVGEQSEIWDYNYEVEDEVKGIYLSCSLPRLLSDTNLKTLSYDEQKTALNNLQERLKQYGIKTNIYNANLSRLDTFTNITTEFPFYSYADLFSLMECSRMKAVGWGDESFLWKNGNQELMIYDKIKEMKQKKPDVKIRTDRNIMRFENRLLKKRKIESSIKFKTVGELYKNYDDLKHFHKSEIGNKIFKYSFSDIEGLTKDKLESQFVFCKKQFGNKWLDSFFKMEGMKVLLKTGDQDFLFRIVDILDSDKKDFTIRKKKSRLRKLYSEMKFYIGMFENKFKEGRFKTNAELYNELKEKFYKQVA